MFPITDDTFREALDSLSIMDASTATIRQICSLAAELENRAGEEMIHLEIGNPGLPAEEIGVNAEVEVLKNGIANQYPSIQGIPQVKKAGSRFLKAFLNVDISPKSIIPTVGLMQGTFTAQLLLSQRMEGKDTMLFVNPGFPANTRQAHVLGIKAESFDIYSYRGKKLETKLESYLSKGNVTALLYSNPNNPAWTNLTEEELEIIGRLATKYDCIVMEDMAYFGMDFRRDISHPFEPPYGATVARYTDNYILMLSGSKMFSYAGQRIGLMAFSDKAYERKYEKLQKLYNIASLGDAYVYSILYCVSSGTAHSAQHALAAMLNAACDGKLNFVDHCREYERRAKRVKEIFLSNGFHIVYDRDGDDPIADGFFFTIGYKNMTGGELQTELIKYGVSSIALNTTGSEQNGIRACVSMIKGEEAYERLNRFLSAFASAH
jgi:aspartate/methionine/tyrosine aminotransferase